MGPGGFFPTNPDLADILERTDFDFENFHFSVFFGLPTWARLGPSLGPAWAQLGPGLGPAWAQLGPGLRLGLGPGLGPRLTRSFLAS